MELIVSKPYIGLAVIFTVVYLIYKIVAKIQGIEEAVSIWKELFYFPAMYGLGLCAIVDILIMVGIFR